MELRTVLDKALQLERAAGTAASCQELAELFGKTIEDLEPVDPSRDLLTYEAGLYRFQLQPTESASGEPLGPFWALPDGRRYPPRVSDFPDGAIDYFRARQETAENLSARARLADFLWLRTRDAAQADQAITEYLGASRAVLTSKFGPMVATEYLGRATAIARSLGRDRSDLREGIRVLGSHLLTTDAGQLCQLAAMTAPEVARDNGLAEWLLSELTQLAEHMAARGGEHRSSERAFLDAAIELTRAKRDSGLVRQLRERRAISFEHEADERNAESPLIQSGRLQEAMKAYAELGMSVELQRVKPKLHDASERAMMDLKEISGKVSIPVERLRQEMQQLVEFGQKRSASLHLQILGLRGLWPPWSDVAARTTELERRFPLQSAVSKVLLAQDGRPLRRPSEPRAARQFDEIRRYVEDVQLRLGLAKIEVEILRELEAWSEPLIMQALNSGLLYSDEVLAAVRPGILAFERGHTWDALHVLVPQIERVVRKAAQLLGANVYRYVSGTGEIHWSSLDSLLQLEPVKALLARIHPDLSDELRYLLVDSRGLNLRDDVAHGIRQNEPDVDSLALLCILVLLTLSLPHIASQQESEPDSEPPDEPA
jgi:hypothetical protein